MRFNTSSPVLTLPLQQPHSFTRPEFSSPFANPSSASPSSAWPSRTPTSSTSASPAGRKRSRDEASENLEDDYFPSLQPLAPEPVQNEDEWEYGEGMVLIKPNRGGYIIEAGSQTGTWAEEKAAAEKQQTMPVVPERPVIRAAKSQRLNVAPTLPTSEQLMSHSTSNTSVTTSPTNGFTEPTVDDFTRHLGIGWSLISADEHIQAAARGWTKFINNHFPVTDAKIRLQSRGLASYLIEANEGYFLFGEDLKQGRLVSTTLEKTWDNLRGPVPIFDGETILEAGETPKPNGNVAPLTNGAEVAMTGIEGIASNELNGGQSMEVDMDMSS